MIKTETINKQYNLSYTFAGDRKVRCILKPYSNATEPGNGWQLELEESKKPYIAEMIEIILRIMSKDNEIMKNEKIEYIILTIPALYHMKFKCDMDKDEILRLFSEKIVVC